MTSYAFLLDFIVRDGDNLAQFFFFIIPYNSTKAFGANSNGFRDKRYHMAIFSNLLRSKGSTYPNFSFTFLSY